MLGKRYGRYEALFELASGGMGAVCLARLRGPHGFRRLVAIKTVHAHLTSNEQYVKMFMREADIASRLHHPNVVPVLELGEQDDEHFLVMEYYPSMPLSMLMRAAIRREDPVPIGVALALGAEACAGLEAAHNLRDSDGAPLNLVHRDITPSNLLIGEDGTLKITDFGIAKAQSAAVANVTRESGMIKGKLAYLSPEQARAETLDRRSDVFCLGIVLFELLAGRRLFRGENELSLLREILQDSIPTVCDVRADFPEAISNVIARALARDPAARFGSAAKLRDALIELQREYPEQGREAYVKRILQVDFDARMREISSAEASLDGVNNTRIDGTPPAAIVGATNAAPPAGSGPDATATVSRTTSLTAVSTARPALRNSTRWALSVFASLALVAGLVVFGLNARNAKPAVAPRPPVRNASSDRPPTETSIAVPNAITVTSPSIAAPQPATISDASSAVLAPETPHVAASATAPGAAHGGSHHVAHREAHGGSAATPQFAAPAPQPAPQPAAQQPASEHLEM